MHDPISPSTALTATRWSSLAYGNHQFRLPRSDKELEQVHRLVYRTFVRELRQYADSGGERWVDKFHHKNVYLLALQGERLDGMLALNDSPPFSITDALSTPEPITSLCPGVLEVRLLAIEPALRRRRLFGCLMTALYIYATEHGYRYLAISGLLQRRRMYENMGFRALGEPILKGEARFVPMLLELSALSAGTTRRLRRLTRECTRIGSSG